MVEKPGRTLIAGATGYVGGRLARRLADDGEPPRCMARDPGKAEDLMRRGCEIVKADVLEPESLDPALDGVTTAFYLVHSMGRGADSDFAARDRQAAVNFAQAAKRAGAKQIIYLGGLGGGGSEHLSSRHQTAEALGSTQVPVTYLRAAIVIGGGSVSFQTIYYLVTRLPVMVTPRWTAVRTQPIAIEDVLNHLIAAAKSERARGRTIEIGGPEITTYGGLMDSVARAMGRRPPVRIAVPVLSPWLSALWLNLITPVDSGVARPLVEGLTEETVVQDRVGMKLFDLHLTGLEGAIMDAVTELESQRNRRET